MLNKELNFEKWKDFNAFIVDFLRDNNYKFSLLNCKPNYDKNQIIPRSYLVGKGKECFEITVRACKGENVDFKEIEEIYDSLITPKKRF